MDPKTEQLVPSTPEQRAEFISKFVDAIIVSAKELVRQEDEALQAASTEASKPSDIDAL